MTSISAIKAQSNFININVPDLEEAKLHYLTYGNPEDEIVFCVHGLSCNAYDFDYLARDLADNGFYVIAVDIVGRGLSSHWQDKSKYSNENYLSLCVEMLKQLNIKQSVHWIGASMGGIIGMMCCFLYPDKIRSLMLNDVGAVLAKEGLAEIGSYISNRLPIGNNEKFEAAFRERNKASFGLYDEAHWQHFWNSRIYQDEDAILRLRGDYTVVKPLYEMIGDNPQDISLQVLWQAVKCPVLIFRGENSKLFRAIDAKAMTKRNDIIVELHEIKDTGHMPSLMPIEQIEVIRNWLNNIK